VNALRVVAYMTRCRKLSFRITPQKKPRRQARSKNDCQLFRRVRGSQRGRSRINGVLVNMPEFSQAFSCKAGRPMVKLADKVCKVW